MMKELLKYAQKPELYAQSTCKFWDDEHISKGMLEAHLDPNWDGASRRHKFMDESVEWIAQVAPPREYKKLLDLGCGPGLYAERFFRKGYEVTGVDFSKRSIAYAKEKAAERGQDISYSYQNYLEIDYEDAFDLATLIYCDYGALSHGQREVVMKNVYKALTKGGKFVLDVFTMKEFENVKESNTWNVSKEGGFWKPHEHLCLESHYMYEEDVRMNQYIIVDKAEKVDVVRVWFKLFTVEAIAEELRKAGFDKFEIYSDVSGKPYSEESKTMCIVAEK